MSKLFKTLLVWLCILSLPFQGVAAGMRLSCGPAHHQMMVAANQPLAHQDHVVHKHHDEHEHHAVHQDESPGEHPAQGHQGADKCSACASCCTGLGFAMSFPQWPVALHAHAPMVATFKPLLPSFLPEGLERPPRSVLG